MRVIVVDNVKYRVHPIYNNFAASKAGKVISVKRKIPMNGHYSNASSYNTEVTSYDLKFKKENNKTKQKKENIARRR